MAYSYQVTILSALSSGPFYFTDIDGYLSISHIKVYKNGVLQTSGYTINESAKSVTFSVPLPASTVVRIERQTPKTVSGRIADFADGSVLTAQDLDNSSIQNLYIAQEAEDNGSGALGPSLDDLAWDAQNKQIKNVASPTAPGDAVNKLYIDGFQLGNEAWTVPQAWSFSGTGQTTFAWTDGDQPVPTTTDPRMLIVEVGGVIQHPTTNYTVTESNIIFASAVGSAGTPVTVRVRNFGVSRDVPNWTSPITFTNTLGVSGLATLSGGASVSGFPINNGSNNDSSSIYLGRSPAGVTSGSKFNTVVGRDALTNATSGQNNTAVGNQSAQFVSTGSGNTAVGSLALTTPAQPGTSTNTVAIGNQAAYVPDYPVNLNSGIYIGKSATTAATSGTVTNEIVIGNSVTGDGGNTTRIGNGSTTQTKLQGNLIVTGTGTSTINGPLNVGGSIGLASGASGSLALGLMPNGSVLQVVSMSAAGTNTTQTAGTIFIDSVLTASITPSRASSKVLVIFSAPAYASKGSTAGAGNATLTLRIVRNSTTINTFTKVLSSSSSSAAVGPLLIATTTHLFLDSPGSNTSNTYKVQLACETSTTGNEVNYPYTGTTGYLFLIEVAG